jgi:transcriptional regulator with XRE-family HTH domain
MQKTAGMRKVETARGLSLEIIIRQAVEAGWTQEQIAADLGVSRLTLRGWLNQMQAVIRVTRRVEFGSERYLKERL